jgi:maltooligosyltrehalose trehalohydrolase
MNRIDPSARSIGAIAALDGIELAFRVWAPDNKSVSLYFPEREFQVLLERRGFGYWLTNEWTPCDGELYWVVLDDGRFADPASLSQPQGTTGPSQVIDVNKFKWTDAQWSNPSLEQYIIYELHTGTFTPEGTFAGIASRLDHLIELGITAIEIMPVAQFPGSRNWGYDGVFPFAVQNSYGGARELQELIDACHARGIAVILDVVINHMGPEGNHLGQFGPYFTDKYKTPWGSAINFDDAGCDGVRKYFIENILMWFRDFHIDAIRLDAVHAICDFSAEHLLAEIRRYTDQLMKTTGKVHYLIAECDLNDPRYIRPLEQNGYGMHAQWIDEFHHALRVSGGQERSGYYSDFNGVDHLAKAFSSAYVYDGIFSTHRNKTFGRVADGLSGHSFVVFSQNHDQVGNRMLGERTSVLVDFEMLKLMAVAVLISPFIPLLFMGEEYGETNPFLYFISHNSQELVDAVRKGRKKEFEYFFSGNEFPDPQSEEVFNKSKLSWDRISADTNQKLFDLYKYIIRLRKETPALRTMDRNRITADRISEGMISVIRRHDKGDVHCYLNFSSGQQVIPIKDPAGFRLLLRTSDVRWGGDGFGEVFSSGGIVLEKHAAVILLSDHV